MNQQSLINKCSLIDSDSYNNKKYLNQMKRFMILKNFMIIKIINKNFLLKSIYIDWNHKKRSKRFYSTLIYILEKQIYREIMLNNLQTSCASSLIEQYMEDKYVSLCIIVEARICFESSTLIQLSKHKINKLVLIGDHCQQ
ncbi:unnamed protein product [Paramecium primaurelia]|uniref:DNA2/NAM7 helicase helicase domain-containing protein n=1 Tax=Paramecium primaurelia TaxID=5886 RepID=A0A8S1M7G2_PARPR|nr:unnamed protein product [Paramecium primaurelia]